MLKAALAHAGVAPPRIHDLVELMALLEDQGLSADGSQQRTCTHPLGVEFRYDDVLDERLDRVAACDTVMQARAWLDELLGSHP